MHHPRAREPRRTQALQRRNRGVGHARGPRPHHRTDPRHHRLLRLHLRTGVRRRHRRRRRRRDEGSHRGLRALRIRRAARAFPRGGRSIHELIDEAVDAIQRGKAVIVPTDTVYGLATTALHSEPVLTLYRLKRRPVTEPIALLAPDVDMLFELVPELRGRAGVVARALLPGPY